MEDLLLFSPDELPYLENPNPKPCLSKDDEREIRRSRKVLKKLFLAAQLAIKFLGKPLFIGKTKRVKKAVNREFVSNPVDSQNLELIGAEDDLGALSRMSSAHLWAMHQHMFEDSMEALKAVGNADEKMNILEWVFAPTYIERIGKTYDGRPYLMNHHVHDIPFSFANCCRSVGITDTDTFKELLVSEISDEKLRRKLEKYMRIETGWIPTKSRYTAESEKNAKIAC